MKQRSTTPAFKSSLARRITLGVIAGVFAIAGPLQFMPRDAAADRFDDQIAAIQREIDKYQGEAAKLAKKGDSLQRKLNTLANQRKTLQAKIDLNQAKHDRLQKRIEENKKRIEANRDALGTTLADMYIEGKISPLEMLASSSTIGDYLDRQERLSSVRDNIKTTIADINRAQEELAKQQKQVKEVLADQAAQRRELVSKQNEQQRLVSETRGKESAYRKLSAQGEAKKRELERQQQEAIQAALRAAGGGGSAVAGDPGRGGYPNNLANSDYYNPIVDPWGMYARQCVSYTAWKVYQKNGHMPYWGGVGNANQWPGNARAAGIPTGYTPKKGSVGVIMAGQYGHVVWVESVNPDGTINISQYNELNAGGPGWGHYSERYNVPASAYDIYIYF